MFPQPQHPSRYPPFPSFQPSYYYSRAVYGNDSYPTHNVQGSQNQPISSNEPPTYYYRASSSNAGYQGSGNSSAYPGNQPYWYGGWYKNANDQEEQVVIKFIYIY